MSFLDRILAGTPISEIATDAGPPVVLTGNTPNAGDTIVATGPDSAEWASTPGGGVIAGNGLLLTANTLSVKPAPGGGLVVSPAGVAVQALATDAQHGNRGGGALHALATDTAAGFMSPAEKLRLASAAVVSEEAPLPNSGAASAGAADEASAADHTHPNDWKGACRAVWLDEDRDPDAAPLYADGVGPLTAGDRILSPGVGVYEVVTPGTGANGVWAYVPSNVTTHSVLWVAEGDTYAGTVWRGGVGESEGEGPFAHCGPFVTYRPPCDFVSLDDQTLFGVPGAPLSAPSASSYPYPDAGARVLLTGQDDAAENGPWVIMDGPWIRPEDFARSADIGPGIQYVITYGYPFQDVPSGGGLWSMDDPGEPFVLGVTSSSWTHVNGTAGLEIGFGLMFVNAGRALEVNVHPTDGSIVIDNPQGLRVGVLKTDVQHGNRGGGAIHADATTTVSGFFSGPEKVKLAGIAAGAAALTTTLPTQIQVIGTAVAGVSTDAAHRDHQHSVAVGTASALTPGGSNSAGSGANLIRDNHIHALPAFGSASGTFAQGNDSRFGKASVLSSAGDVSIAAAAAPVQGQALTANAATTAVWAFANNGGVNQLRLSVSNSQSVPTTDVPTATAIYLIPHSGAAISLWSTTLNQCITMITSGVTLNLSGLTVDAVYDVFAYLSNQANPFAGNVAIEALQWTSSSARATSVIRNTATGFYVKSGDDSRRYVGTFRARAANSISWHPNGNDASPPRVDLWNIDNQVPIMSSFQFTAATYAVSAASAWQVLGNAKLEFVQGQLGSPVSAVGVMSTNHASAGNEGNAVFLQDAALTTPVGLRGKFKVGAANETGQITPALQWLPTSIGSRTLSMGLLSNVTTQVFYGTDGGGMQSGFNTTLMC
jgi:hypothetical protein